METANAFHMLILPVLQCTAGILAAFAMIHLAQVASGFLYASGPRLEPSRLGKGSPHAASYRPATGRHDRPNARHLGLYR